MDSSQHVTSNISRFAPANLTPPSDDPEYASLISTIASTEKTRVAFTRLLLAKLGLKVNDEEQSVLALSPLHVSSYTPTAVADLVASWAEVITVVGQKQYIKGENDVFLLEKHDEGDTWGVQGLKEAVEVIGEKVADMLPETITGKETADKSSETLQSKPGADKEEDIRTRITYSASAQASPTQLFDLNLIIKSLIPHTTSFPPTTLTPAFNHEAYYTALQAHNSRLALAGTPTFGQPLLYTANTTSTNTILEKNPTLLRVLEIREQNLIEDLCMDGRILDRDQQLDASVEVARRPVSRRDEELGLIAGQDLAVAEGEDAAVLEEAADDGADMDVLAHAGNAGAQAAVAADDQFDLHPGPARLVELLDDRRIDE